MSYGWGSGNWSSSAGADQAAQGNGWSWSRSSWNAASNDDGRSTTPQGWDSTVEKQAPLAPSRGQHERIRGRVKDWNATRGFGFVSNIDADYFTHFSAILGDGFKSLADGEDVEFEVETDPSTGKLRAINVTGPDGAPVKGGGRNTGRIGEGSKGKGKAKKGKDSDFNEAAGHRRESSSFSWSPSGREDAGREGGYRVASARPNSVFVAGLSWDTGVSALRDHFEPAGDIVDVHISMDRETGRSRGFGKVAFALPEQAQEAIETLDGSDLDGRSISVRKDNPPAKGKGKGDGSPDASAKRDTREQSTSGVIAATPKPGNDDCNNGPDKTVTWALDNGIADENKQIPAEGAGHKVAEDLHEQDQGNELQSSDGVEVQPVGSVSGGLETSSSTPTEQHQRSGSQWHSSNAWPANEWTTKSGGGWETGEDDGRATQNSWSGGGWWSSDTPAAHDRAGEEAGSMVHCTIDTAKT